MRVAVPGDEAGAFEDLQMLRDGGLGDGKWLGQFRYRRLPDGEPGEDFAAGGVGESSERGVQDGVDVGCGRRMALQLHNHMVMYEVLTVNTAERGFLGSFRRRGFG